MAITIQTVIYKDRFTVEPGQSWQVSGVRATGSGAAGSPVIVAGATVAAVTATGTGAARVPVVSAASPGNATAVTATGTGMANASTVTGIQNATVAGVAATATGVARVPVVAGAGAGAVTAVAATGTGAAPVPTVAGIRNATVVGVVATGTGAAPAGGVVDGGGGSYSDTYSNTYVGDPDVNVAAVKATGTGAAGVPTVPNATVAAVKATATGAAGVPAVSGGGVLASETFTGTSGAWPGQWTPGPTGTYALASNRGSITPVVTAYLSAYESLSGMTGITGNWNFKVNVGFPAGLPECYHAIGMSSTGTTAGAGNSYTAAGYSLVFFANSGSNNVQLFKDGVFAAQGTFTYSSGVTVNVEWSRVGTLLTVWMWLSSGSKGASLFTFDDTTSPVTGALKALLVAGNGAAQQAATFDDLTIT
jgi:hypothetical protein